MAFNNDQWQEAVVSLGNTGAAPPDTSTSGTVTTNNDAVTITLPGGQSTALIQITGTFVGTLNFEASPDGGTTYYSVQASIVGGSTLATTATAVGAWRCNISGFTNFRVRFSPVTSGTATIVIRLSAGVHNVFINNASALGQAVMANSSPVVLASDQTDIAQKAAWKEIAGQSAGSVTSTSTPIITAFDCSAYRTWSFQMTGTWTMTLQVQFSNDNANFSVGAAFTFQGNLGTPGSSISANGLYNGDILGRYMRIIPTAWTSNASGVGTLELFASPMHHPAVFASAQSPFTVQPGNTQNTTPWLNQGPTTNATATANAGTGKAIKASAGALWSAAVTATGTAATTLYDNASAASGTALLTIPANAAVGSLYSFPGGAPAANGIYADQVANAPSITVYYR